MKQTLNSQTVRITDEAFLELYTTLLATFGPESKPDYIIQVISEKTNISVTYLRDLYFDLLSIAHKQHEKRSNVEA